MESEKEGNRVFASRKKTSIQYSRPSRKSAKGRGRENAQGRVVARMNKSKYDAALERLKIVPSDLVQARQEPKQPIESAPIARSPRARRFSTSLPRITAVTIGKQDHDLIRMFAAP